MNKLLKKVALTASAYFLPLAAFAQNATQNATINNLSDFFSAVNGVINVIIPFLVGLAVFIIIWGVFTYIAGAGDEEKRATAKSFIIWGVVGVFIMLSIWGLVSILANTLKLKKDPILSGDALLPTFQSNFPQPVSTGSGVNAGGGGVCQDGFNTVTGAACQP